MLVQSHGGVIRLLPAVPADWAVSGSFAGLRARGGYRVDCTWRDGKVVSYDVVADRAPNMSNVVVVVNGGASQGEAGQPEERQAHARPRSGALSRGGEGDGDDPEYRWGGSACT
ncbi:hypothetical protein JM654_18900 [Microbacterium oxydans]|nr:hypothetical protein [Microbacterium oxydans]